MSDDELITVVRHAAAIAGGPLEAKLNAAADRIEALVGAMDGLQDRLEAALAPFVAHAKDREVNDPAWKDSHSITIVVTVADLRAALEGGEG